MSYDSFNTNCPHFAIGCCNSFKDGGCKYKYHKRCDENFLCKRYDCKFGHGITPEKRIIVNDIYDEKYSSNSAFETSDKRCKMPMNCIAKDCNCDHHLDFEDRNFIYKIVNPEFTDKAAKAEYAKKYCKGASPFSDAMSAGSTMPSVSPIIYVDPPTPPAMTMQFSALFKFESGAFEDLDEQSDDDMVKLMDDMLLIRKDIAVKNKAVADIKGKIKKMEEELSLAENDVNVGKANLKELAIKIANI